MATFTSFLDILPDPNVKIGNAGQADASGTAGPGFASVELSDMSNDDVDRTIRGKSIVRTQNAHKWLIKINYNPLTQAEFTPIYTFLMEKRNSRKPFYVSLPQYRVPKNADFAIYTASNPIYTTEAKTAGASAIEIDDTEGSIAGNNLPSFGDLFYFSDTDDSLHTKAYMVSRVETQTNYQTGNQPGVSAVRVHFNPALQRNVSSGAEIVFYDPLIRVTQVGNIQEYNLNNDGLYLFSLNLMEALY